jgi:lipoprotein-anchoring transpeptidase ErfK/SrfK
VGAEFGLTPARVTTVRTRIGRTRRPLALAAALTALVTLAACTAGTNNKTDPPSSTSTGGGDSTGTPSSTGATSTPTQDGAKLAVITAAPAGKTVSPKTPVTVSVADGKLTAVKVTNPTGKSVSGSLSADSTTWTSSEPLGYNKTYAISATAVNVNGAPTSKTASFTTIQPDNMTMPYLQRIGGYPLQNGATYGVGIVPVVHFDEPITNKAAAEKALVVTTTPHIDGSWYWADSQNAHWRPDTPAGSYWPSGTTVTVSANVYGVEVGHGLYGQQDKSLTFKIGRKQITVADDNAPKAVNKVRVYNSAGTVIRTMNTSMGEHSGVTVNGNFINFYTMGGTYTVLEHDNPAIMSSASYGLPADGPGGYAPEPIYWSTKISTDGIYLHELDTTTWAQDHGADVSHGCLNLNHANAVWFYQHSMVGDPVVIHGAKGAPTVQVWQGGDWTIPWSTWAAGSALH